MQNCSHYSAQPVGLRS